MTCVFNFDENHNESRVVINQDSKGSYTAQIQRRRELASDEICFEVKTRKPAGLLRGNFSELLMLAKGFTLFTLSDIEQKLRVGPILALVDRVFDRLPSSEAREPERQLFKDLYSDPLESERAFCKRKNLNYTTFRSRRLVLHLPAKEKVVKFNNKLKSMVDSGKTSWLCNHDDCNPCRTAKRKYKKNK